MFGVTDLAFGLFFGWVMAQGCLLASFFPDYWGFDDFLGHQNEEF